MRFWLAWLAVCPSVWLWAEDVRGEVTGTAFPQNYAVEARPLGASGHPARALVTPSGEFFFHDLAAGPHEFVVLNARGDIVQRAFTQVSTFGLPLSFHIHEQSAARPVSPVSPARLLRDPHGKALRALRDGEWYLRHRNAKRARREFEKALAIDPEFPEAHALLGVSLHWLHDRPAAHAHLREAFRLNPKLEVPGLVIRSTPAATSPSVDPQSEAPTRPASRVPPLASR